MVSEGNIPLIYYNTPKITNAFLGSQDLIRNSSMNHFANYRDSELINGFIFSEIESSLAIEGVRSTRAHIEKINDSNYDDLSKVNDIIIKNMLLGYDYVKRNDITEENIYELYKILSKNSLEENEKLKSNNYYRHDDENIVNSVRIVVDRGVDHALIPKLMKDLIDYIHKDKTYEEHLIASHVIHYYLVFLHPYFDFNGRMARVLSFWYNYKYVRTLSLLLVSEAINNNVYKNGYYNAIANSKQMENDITYFLEFMGSIILKYSKVYINFYSILEKLKGRGVFLNRSTELVLKNVLSLPRLNDEYFDWRDYRNFTKQYYFKLLNELEELNILVTKEHKNAKLFKLNTKEWDLM